MCYCPFNVCWMPIILLESASAVSFLTLDSPIRTPPLEDVSEQELYCEQCLIILDIILRLQLGCCRKRTEITAHTPPQKSQHSSRERLSRGAGQRCSGCWARTNGPSLAGSKWFSEISGLRPPAPASRNWWPAPQLGVSPPAKCDSPAKTWARKAGSEARRGASRLRPRCKRQDRARLKPCAGSKRVLCTQVGTYFCWGIRSNRILSFWSAWCCLIHSIVQQKDIYILHPSCWI